jgi:hypothetical protein
LLPLGSFYFFREVFTSFGKILLLLGRFYFFREDFTSFGKILLLVGWLTVIKKKYHAKFAFIKQTISYSSPSQSNSYPFGSIVCNGRRWRLHHSKKILLKFAAAAVRGLVGVEVNTVGVLL